MADWAKVMAALTLATFIITAAGVWLVKLTLDATLEAVKDTGRGTKEMVEANRIAREINDVQLRPYLFVDKVVTESRSYECIKYTTNLANSGLTPARLIKVRISSFVVSLCRGAISNFHTDTFKLLDCAPGKERHNRITMPLQSGTIEGVEAGTKVIIYRILYRYYDESGRSYRERFDFVYTTDSISDGTFFSLSRYVVKGMIDVARERRKLT